MNLPFDQFAESYRQDPSAWNPDNFEANDIPPTFLSHPVALANPKKAVPLGYFSDGFPITKKDGCIAHYWSNSLTGVRYLICVIRKSDLCRCGCKGFCTHGTILRVIAWAFNVFATGLYPSHDHENKPFEDVVRANKYNFPIAENWVGALCELRADLLEIFERVGVKTFANVINPCFGRSAHKTQLYNFPVSMEAMEWVRRDEVAYNIMMHRSLVTRTVTTPQQLHRLMNCMSLDEDIGGYGLHAPFPELDIQKGHRLIEDGQLHDIHALKDCELPIALTFFNTCINMGLNLICPLFRIAGFTYSMIHLDAMHVLDLGVTQYLIGAVFLLMVKKNFARSRHFKADGRRAANITHLRRRWVR
eukprot:5084637-Pyramimonas_sp.AAC.1